MVLYQICPAFLPGVAPERYRGEVEGAIRNAAEDVHADIVLLDAAELGEVVGLRAFFLFLCVGC